MTPATNPSLLDDKPETESVAARKILTLPVRVAATISTRDGRYVTGGVLELMQGDTNWRGRVRHLDRPGNVATMYFGEGMRDVIVRLEDGRRGVARITGTSFIASTERICELEGSSSLV